MYLSGYVYLLLFPLVAYASLSDLRPLKRIALGISLNYLFGLLFYTLFISYGPRNMLPELIRPLLYETYPRTQILTSTVNANTNVFPSLHSSLSVTVLLLAYRTRGVYPGWFLLTIPIVGSIVLATMYLGIHWAIDVLAGALLAVVSVHIAARYHDIDGVPRL